MAFEVPTNGTSCRQDKVKGALLDEELGMKPALVKRKLSLFGGLRKPRNPVGFPEIPDEPNKRASLP